MALSLPPSSTAPSSVLGKTVVVTDGPLATVSLRDADDDFPLVVVELAAAGAHLSSFFHVDSADADSAYASATPRADYDAAIARAAAAASRARARVARTGRTAPGLAMDWVVAVVTWAGRTAVTVDDAFTSAAGHTSAHYRRAAAAALGGRDNNSQSTYDVEALPSLIRKLARFKVADTDGALARVRDNGYYGAWGYVRDSLHHRLSTADYHALAGRFCDLAAVTGAAPRRWRRRRGPARGLPPRPTR